MKWCTVVDYIIFMTVTIPPYFLYNTDTQPSTRFLGHRQSVCAYRALGRRLSILISILTYMRSMRTYLAFGDACVPITGTLWWASCDVLLLYVRLFYFKFWVFYTSIKVFIISILHLCRLISTSLHFYI